MNPGPLAPGWAEVIAGWHPPGLDERLAARRAAGVAIFPTDPFRALRLTALADVRAVILGQDPYHGPGQAEGLAFSVPPGVKPPPSLRNLLNEWQRDLDRPPPASGHLGAWAEQGVLLLNTVLTVEQGQPASHAGWGWESLTDAVIAAVSRSAQPTAFLLWGAHAQAKAPLIDGSRHLLLRANHPSPLAARRPPLPFMGCAHFSQSRAWLAAQGRKLDWHLPPADSLL